MGQTSIGMLYVNTTGEIGIKFPQTMVNGGRLFYGQVSYYA